VSETRVRRLPEIRRNKRLRSFGVWSALDVLGVRDPAAIWLRRLERCQRPILAVFAEGDDGLEFLEDRTGRAWRRSRQGGLIEYAIVSGIDHPMHRHWYRTTMVDTIEDWLDATLPADPPARASGEPQGT
jgi:hypothetical protein